MFAPRCPSRRCSLSRPLPPSMSISGLANPGRPGVARPMPPAASRRSHTPPPTGEHAGNHTWTGHTHESFEVSLSRERAGWTPLQRLFPASAGVCTACAVSAAIGGGAQDRGSGPFSGEISGRSGPVAGVVAYVRAQGNSRIPRNFVRGPGIFPKAARRLRGAPPAVRANRACSARFAA